MGERAAACLLVLAMREREKAEPDSGLPESNLYVTLLIEEVVYLSP